MEYVSSAGNISQEEFLAIAGSNGTYGGDAAGVGGAGGGGGGGGSLLGGTIAAMLNETLGSAAAASAAAAAAAAGTASGESGAGENLTILHGTYPSGYTLPHIIIASIIVTILMIVIVVGNMLVIIAIATEKTLKNIQNWFIASLAVADFFLGLVIMPFSLANELMGYWIFGNWWCDIHSAMDVLLCTSSIMNLCLISLDRYWSITKAIEYLKSRTPARAAFMIAAVWIMSALVCIPPLLGWKAKRPEGHVELPQCQLSEDIGYVLYSALGSFYIPSCIMVFVYIRIYFAAKARARRGIRKKPLKPPSEQDTSFTRNAGTVPMPSLPSASNNNNQSAAHQQHQPAHHSVAQIATIEPPPRGATGSAAPSAPMPIPVVTCDFASDMSTSEAGTAEQDNHGPGHQHHHHPVGAHGEPKDTLKVQAPPSLPMQQQQRNSNNGISSELAVSPSGGAARGRALSVGIDTDMVSEFDPSSSDSGVISRCAVVKPLKFRLCQPIFGKGKAKARQAGQPAGRGNNCTTQPMLAAGTASEGGPGTPGGGGGGGASPGGPTPGAGPPSAGISQLIAAKQTDSTCSELEPALPKPKPRDPEKEKRRIARKKEKRATLILGLIMGSFIACWLPFFFLYILVPICPACSIPDSAFSLAFWLGYMNSALNPAIYTIFNKDFRRAFRRILFK